MQHGSEPTTEGFREFVAVVDAGSISLAARRLGVPRASLSRRIAALEERLGIRLLHRGSRSMALTSAGAELETRARHILSESKAAWDAVRRLDGVPRGLLRVSTPPEVGRGALSVMLLEFMARYPEVQLETIATVRHVDLAAEGIDVALRAGTRLDPALVSRVLFRFQQRVMASESYLKRRGAPSVPEDLTDHDCVRGFSRGRTPARGWMLADGREIPVSGRILTNNLVMQVAAAGHGFGLALLPEGLPQTVWDGPPMIPVLEDVRWASSTLALVYPEKEFLDPKVRAFVDHCAEWVVSHDLW